MSDNQNNYFIVISVNVEILNVCAIFDELFCIGSNHQKYRRVRFICCCFFRILFVVVFLKILSFEWNVKKSNIKRYGEVEKKMHNAKQFHKI